MRPAVFLDRDGTLIEYVAYVRRLDQVVLFPWTVDAVRLLNRAGFVTVVVTNQSAVARGLTTEDFVRETHRALESRLAAAGAHIDAYYYCPHHPQGKVEAYRRACRCRKPAHGMIEQAASDLALDVTRSWMIGDSWIDVEAGVAAGARSILLESGPAAQVGEAPAAGTRADAILNNLMEAVGWILRASTSR
jgi:D-glycero-D-manno-heptose 1,7-bisphosphate phosphatase